MLVDLRELATRDGRVAEAERRVLALRERNAAKKAFLKRLDAAGLGVGGEPTIRLGR